MRLCLSGLMTLIALVWAQPVRAMDIEEVRAHGLRAWLVQDSLPLVHVSLGWHQSTPPDLAGLPHVMFELLQEGTTQRDALAFRRALADLGAKWRSRVSAEGGRLDITMLAHNKEQVWALVLEALRAPRFDRADIRRVKANSLSIQKHIAQSPSALASMLWQRASFAQSPDGQPRYGTPNSISAMTRQDILNLHTQWLTQSHSIVSVVGDITPDELRGWLGNLAEVLPKGTARKAPPAPPDWHNAGRLLQVHIPGPQTELTFGQYAPAYDTQEYYALQVLQVILSGGLKSRLMQSLREERGWTYGINMQYRAKGATAIWIGSVASENSHIDDAYALIKDTLQDVIANSVDPEHLARAKQQISGSLIVSLRSGRDIADRLTRAQYYGLTRDFVKAQRQAVRQVTLVDIQSVAARYMQPEQLFAIAVGDSSELLPSR